MPRPRVLYASFDVVPSPKGASTHILAFAEALASVYDVDLVTLHREGLPLEETLAGCRCLRIRAAHPNLIERVELFRQGLADRIAAEPYRLAHFRSIWEGIPILGLARRAGTRLLFEANGFPSVELPHHYPWLARRKDFLASLRVQETACLVAADAVVTPSAVTGAYVLGRGVLPSRVTVIPNGVDPSRFVPSPLPVDGPATLLYTGTLAPWQGLGVPMAAMRRIAREVPVRLHVVGGGRKEWVRHYRDLARKMRVKRLVRFSGDLAHDAVPEAIRAASVGLAPLTDDPRNTVQGCCPIKVLEYMACGRPVVASDLPVVRELVTHDGEALLVRPGSVHELAGAVLMLLRDGDRARRMGEAGRRRAEALTWERACRRLLATTERLLQGLRPVAGSVRA